MSEIQFLVEENRRLWLAIVMLQAQIAMCLTDHAGPSEMAKQISKNLAISLGKQEVECIGDPSKDAA